MAEIFSIINKIRDDIFLHGWQAERADRVDALYELLRDEPFDDGQAAVDLDHLLSEIASITESLGAA